MPKNWTYEEIAKMESLQIRNLLDNASQRNRPDIVELCERALESRIRAGRTAMQVREFHFVCRDGEGVRDNGDGTFQSGDWVVSEVHCEPARRYGALLALHETKDEPSYRQGVIVGWEPIVKSEYGDTQRVRFTVKSIDTPLEWVGGGSGEKGYAWAEHH